jgi:hypothetical protein
MTLDELTSMLIVLCSGERSVAMIYRFLLKANNYNEPEARAEFIKYLGGELSERMLADARRWIRDEQSPAPYSEKASSEERGGEQPTNLTARRGEKIAAVRAP